MLSGPEIRRQRGLGNIIVEPWNDASVGPNSVDLHLGDEIGCYFAYPGQTIPRLTSVRLDPEESPRLFKTRIPDDGIWLDPNRLYLAATLEHTETRGLVPRIGGVSTNGRYGITVHQTAGEGEDNFKGTWTLEIVVIHPTKLRRGMRIGCIMYELLQGERQPYSGRYQGQRGVTGPRQSSASPG